MGLKQPEQLHITTCLMFNLPLRSNPELLYYKTFGFPCAPSSRRDSRCDSRVLRLILDDVDCIVLRQRLSSERCL